jgi:hypothetical protein
MASFIIALVVGGLDVVLGLIIVVGLARPHRGEDVMDLKLKLVGGGVSMYCLNCLSVPLCLVGVGLSVVALIAHKDRNHLFTWIGLLGNGVVILAVVGLYVLGAILGD